MRADGGAQKIKSVSQMFYPVFQGGINSVFEGARATGDGYYFSAEGAHAEYI